LGSLGKAGGVMNIEYEDTQVYRVLRGPDGRWQVTQRDRKKPLAKFDRMEDAMQYARDFLAEQRLCRHLGLRQYV